MFILLVLAIGIYFYKTGDLQLFLNRVSLPNSSTGDEPRKIIQQRYASGQISLEEYEKLKNII